MTEIKSVAPVVLVMVKDVPEAGIACTTFALVVMSLATQFHEVELVNEGEIPVTVDVLLESRKVPAIMCEVVEVEVFAQAPPAASEAPQ